MHFQLYKVTGGAGNDTYIFNLGDGQLEITDANGYDGLKFGEGITKDDVTMLLVPSLFAVRVSSPSVKVLSETRIVSA
jgi:hypothetical protein